MTRYAQIVAATLVCGMARAQDLDDCEPAFGAFYPTFLDSLSYFVPDSLIKFFTKASLFAGHNVRQGRYDAQECKFTQNSSTSLVLLLLTFLLIALSLGVLIIMMRSLLREEIGKVEAKQLIHREQSAFGFGLSASSAGRADTIRGDDNNEEELDATPGHLHAVDKAKEIALISDAEARKRCCAEHSPSISPLPFIEDILLDKVGLEDIPCPPSPEIQKERLTSVETLNTVPERLCEDSLDDTHAFCDASYHKASQRKSLSSINECSYELEKSTSHGTNDDVSTRAQ